MVRIPSDDELAKMTPGQRAMIAADLYGEGQVIAKVHRKARREWIAAARAGFAPGPSQPCSICGNYNGITQAHHVLPLSMQFELGFGTADHEFIWVCPNHHIGLHRIIAALLLNVQPDLLGFPPRERDAMSHASVRFVEKWVAVRK